MSKISRAGSINNKIQNNKMLMFEKKTMSEEQFIRLYDSYRQLFWFQIKLDLFG